MNSEIFKQVLGALITILVLDAMWLGIITKSLWEKQINQIQNTSGPIEFRKFPAFLAYLTMVTVIGGIGLPLLETDWFNKINKPWSYGRVFLIGLFLGLAMYGVFDFTNLAIFKKYQWKTAIIDLTWGVFVISMALLVTKWFKN